MFECYKNCGHNDHSEICHTTTNTNALVKHMNYKTLIVLKKFTNIRNYFFNQKKIYVKKLTKL